MIPLTASALETPPVSTDHTVATGLSESDTYAPGHPFRLGLRLRIAPGWHTYWLNPGDAGAPPTLDVTGASAGPIDYPTPSHEQDGPFTSFVYVNQVLLPVTVTPPASAAGPLHVQAHGTWLVCAKVCVPEEASFALDLPAGSGAPGPQAAAFAAARAATPRQSPFPARIAADGTLRLDAPGLAPETAYFFPADAGVIDQGAAQPFTADAAGLTIRLKPLHALKPGRALDGVLTLTDRMGRTEALRVAANPGGAAAASAPGLARALVLALLGGLILNLMPCVLPVLAMKALALAKLSGAQKREVRIESLLYTAGVLTAFAVIGGTTLVVGAAGGAAGWGVQFQSAWFCAAMALVMLAVGLNFSGLFEVGAGVAGLGQGLAARGSFFTGLLAVVVATPCTAPFMATALAAAVALPPLDGMAIFLALGMGLAAPYALLAASPALARLLPRPGAWMQRLRQILALPMYATAAWLAWVVWRQAGPPGLAAVLGAGIIVGVAAALWGQRQRGETPNLRNAALGTLVVALTVGGLSARLPAAAPSPLAAGAEAFSPARLAALRAAHRPVLVDMSAAWCITCLVNERVALSPAPVRAAFASHNVAYLVGDWTRQDPDITAFLKQYGRDGVPLYVWYPADGDPVVLPQILTEADILGRLGA